jgi:hypothetical protein
MDLLLGVVVWSLGAWLAYRLARRTATGPSARQSPRSRPPGAHPWPTDAPPNKEPRRRQEGMDVRRRRGQEPAYRPEGANAATRRDFFRRVPSSADTPRPGPSGR